MGQRRIQHTPKIRKGRRVGQRMGKKRVKGDDRLEPTDSRVREVRIDLNPTDKLLPGQRVKVFAERKG